MNIVEVLSGDWWDGPMRVVDDPSENLLEDKSYPGSLEDALSVVSRLVYEFLGTHPDFVIRPKEKSAFVFLADYAGVEWKLPTITSA